MDTEKTMDSLKQNILCEHRSIFGYWNIFHNHDGYEIFLLLRGDLNLYVEQAGAQVERGNVVLIKPYDFHRRYIVKGDSYERIVINIKDTYMEKLCSDQTNLAACFYNKPADKVNILKLNEQQILDFMLSAQRLSQELESDEYGSGIMVDTYIKQILVMINRISNNTNYVGINNIMPSLVSNTIAYIEQNITNGITLNALSEHFHHNGTYISRTFKKTTGISLNKYIVQKRINMSQKYMCAGYRPYDACYLSGFNDYSNFSRTFKKQTGLSPKEFISQNT